MKLTTEQRHQLLEEQGVQNLFVSPEEFDLLTQNWDSQFFLWQDVKLRKDTILSKCVFLIGWSLLYFVWIPEEEIKI